MMDKERLEHIKNKTRNLCYEADEYGNAEANVQAIYNDMIWLIQQAERAQKIEQILEDMDRQLYSEQQRNKRYRKAINNIIEKAMLFGTNEEVYEAIQDAIKALEGERE